MTVTGARAAFLGGLIDYAGLFPPASLDLAAAMDTYVRHLDEPDAWMLGRFIVPVDRLDELDPWLEGPFTADRPLVLSVLIGGGDTAATARENFRTGLARIAAYAGARPGVRIEAVETRLPVDLVAAGQTAPLVEHLEQLREDQVAAGLATVSVWVESPADAAADPDGPALMALARAATSHGDGSLPGYKLRCGGVTAASIPTVERIASVLSRAAKLDVSLKFTAGLHHPVRGMATVDGVPMHGFLNVIGGALLAGEHGLSETQLQKMVAETDLAAFALDDESFSWRGHATPTGAVIRLRGDVVAGYGSCSFDEPCDDLRSLGLLA